MSQEVDPEMLSICLDFRAGRRIIAIIRLIFTDQTTQNHSPGHTHRLHQLSICTPHTPPSTHRSYPSGIWQMGSIHFHLHGGSGPLGPAPPCETLSSFSFFLFPPFFFLSFPFALCVLASQSPSVQPYRRALSQTWPWVSACHATLACLVRRLGAMSH